MVACTAPEKIIVKKNKKLINEINDFSDKKEIKAYYDMLLIRRFEEKAGQLYGMGQIGGFCHLYIGQEAVVTGIQMALKKGDQSITAYRDHAHMLAAGLLPKNIMAELTGRKSGLSKGKGGSMHMFSREKFFYGGHGIVGAQVSIGTGLAFSNKYNNTNNICITYMGDGASNQGQFYESLNMAKLWNLSIVYIIENNQYAMGTAVHRASSQTDFSKRGISFNIPGIKVDGMDVRTVYNAAKDAIKYSDKNGPIILEMMTYRYRGHSMSDPAKYRSKNEVQRIRSERDPIEQVKIRILKKNIVSENYLKQMDKKIRSIIKEAANFAITSPEPEASELWTDVLIEN